VRAAGGRQQKNGHELRESEHKIMRKRTFLSAPRFSICQRAGAGVSTHRLITKNKKSTPASPCSPCLQPSPDFAHRRFITPNSGVMPAGGPARRHENPPPHILTFEHIAPCYIKHLLFSHE
jgi:hypothetical protein